jgi:hypothetical protein
MRSSSIPFSKKMRNNFPLIIACMVLFSLLSILVRMILRETGGVFMYALDDPFIHMQVAKNLALYNTWGINPHEFESASSSILYTLLLAGCFKLFSVNILIPFIINFIAAVCLLATVHQWLLKQALGNTARTITLLLLVILVPLPVLIISGMEHTLQCFFSFLFLSRFSDWLATFESDTRNRNGRIPLPVLAYALLVVSIRYEGLFLVAIACLVLAWRKKFITAFVLGIIAVIPVIIFGVYSVAHGSYFLPNSVLVKSEQIQFSPRGIIQFLQNVLIQKLTVAKPPVVPVPGIPPPGISLLATQRLLVLLPLAFFLFRPQLRQNRSYSLSIGILLSCTLLHLVFATTGWFYRYEAYLILCATVWLSVIIYKYGSTLIRGEKLFPKLLLGVLLFFLFSPAILRSSAAFSNAKQACINIYQQQYQMGQFINRNYNDLAVAANDIGAASYYSKTKMIDLWGLGNNEVARGKKGKYWTPAFLDSLVTRENVKVVMVYDEWFDKALLQRWTKVATWTIHNNVICGGDTVSFYAVNQADRSLLEQQLRAYASSLPQGVDVGYMNETINKP